MRFALIAGEASGDLLGAALVQALRQRFPGCQCRGVTGPRMRAAGCDSMADIEALSVMGIAEVVPKLPAILRLRRQLVRQLKAHPVDAVIGIDAPDFNLGLERRLRRAGMRTVHVVSPSIWAWRPGRVKGIVAAVDLMLCLLPFEPEHYDRATTRPGFRAAFIGHPLAESLAYPVSRDAARRTLGVADDAPVLALLPGSRGGEVRQLIDVFVDAASQLAPSLPGLQVVVPVAKPSLRPLIETAVARARDVDWHLVDGQSEPAMRAADAVLLASGTATLECLLLDRPMVVGYRVAPLTARLLRAFSLLKIDRFSLPNLLCAPQGDAVVPELIQEALTAGAAARALLPLFTDPAVAAQQRAAFATARDALRQDAASRAADEIARLLAAP